MPAIVRPSRSSQILAWAVATLFVAGFFFPLVGAWTGPILGVWFVGTQRPWRGFLWMLVFAVVGNWHNYFPLTSSAHALDLAWILLGSVLGILPFTFHRLTSPRLPGFLSTFPLPLAAVAIPALAVQLQHIDRPYPIGVRPFLIYWFAATVLWMWNYEFRGSKIAVGASLIAVVFILAGGYGLFRHFSGAALPQTLLTATTFGWICLAGALVLSVWVLFRPDKHQTWADRPQTLALLQSPYTGEPLHVVSEGPREALLSSSGERFPIRNGIPVFLKPEDLTGANLKYNHLYETIAGFYDDTQRVWYDLKGMDRDALYLSSYLDLLEIKPGDSVLETSVGTGLNFKYLPRGVKLFGLDLSPEMLSRCQANLRRWELDASLFVGNAETLPFANSSFDVVFHVGGINFFSDRAQAIREMIRVAKPGSLILIADETEVHAKSVYENFPITGRYFKNRKQPVTAPVDLVPSQMQEVRLLPLLDGHFYALTFRKPAPEEQNPANQR
jgi:ubiquinone/menaquinone biosynthesis C-methylase UbiE